MSRMLRYAGAGLILLGIILAAVALATGPKAVQGDATCQMKAKDRVITGVYKAYGMKECILPMWLAKTVFRNGTNGRITNLRFRYKVGEYADWCAWHQYAAVDPTQTVVDLYHPIFTSACARLTSRAPAELQMEYEYTDARGDRQEASETRSLTMVGRHEFFFSDLTAGEATSAFQDSDTYSPLLAAWVSRSDDVVARLASMANKKAGGLGASESDESCIKVMRALYEIMRTIHVSYQHPPALADASMSYDSKLVQSLQYPRDTIQKRSGTCIDLAILYAAMLNSVNVTPYLVSLDGHCFPMGRTPSGNLVPVEATCVGDGYAGSRSFEEAYKIAVGEWKKVNANGRFSLIDVRQCWMQGVSNPELEPLPPDILEKWGIVALVDGAGEPPAAVPNAVPQPNQPVAPAAGIAGRWSYSVTAPNGMVTNGVMQIAAQGNQLQLVAQSSYQMAGPDGAMHQFTEANNFTGTLNGQNVAAECNKATYTMDGAQVAPQGLPLRLTLVISPDGRSMQGRVTNSLGMAAAIAAQR